MRAAPLAPGSVGVDLDTPLTPASCAALLALDRPGPRISFAIRYLGDLTAHEADTITGSGLALMPVTHPRGGPLSAALGQQDGINAVSHARQASLPAGITLWLDFEAWTGAAADAIAYVNAWGSMVEAGGFVPGLYVGACAVPLSPAELYHLGVEAYWHSCSEVPDVPSAGYMMIQLDPPDLMLAGVEVDLDIVQRDRKGRVPIAAWPNLGDVATSPGRRASSGSMSAVKP